MVPAGHGPRKTYDGKPWKYLLIPHDAIAENMTLHGLAEKYSS